MKKHCKQNLLSRLLVLVLTLALCSATALAAGYYNPNTDYSRELARNDLSSSERAQLETERANKIEDRYGGKEPKMYGSNDTFSTHYSSVSSGGDGSHSSWVEANVTHTSSVQQSAIQTVHAAAKNGSITVEEANNAIHAIQGAGKTDAQDQVIDTLLSAMGMSNNAQNREEAAILINGTYNNSIINQNGEHVVLSALVDKNGNAEYYEAGRVYRQDANGNWVVDNQFQASPGALNLDQAVINQLINLKIEHSKATSITEKQRIHAEAEAIRNSAGYSGGLDGSFYDPHAGGSSGSGGSGSSGGSTVIEAFSITASCGPNGSISPTGTVKVLTGATRVYAITPNPGYVIKDVIVDGVSVGPQSAYTFMNINGNHTIHATFKLKLELELGSATLTGLDFSGDGMGYLKSGYGFGLSLPVTVVGGAITSATATMSNGDTCGVALTNPLSFVVNAASPTGARVYYVPVATADGPFTCTVTVTAAASDDPGNTITKTVSKQLTIRGSMYEDDFTGDS